MLDTGLFTGHQPMTEAWMAFRAFVERTEDLPVGLLVRRACLNDPGDDVIAGYDAPFPSAASKAGARAFPLILPLSPEPPGAARRVSTCSTRCTLDTRPKLFLWADSDPVLPLETGQRFAAALGGEIDHVIAGAAHFLQEDAGQEIGALIASWLGSDPGAPGGLGGGRSRFGPPDYAASRSRSGTATGTAGPSYSGPSGRVRGAGVRVGADQQDRSAFVIRVIVSVNWRGITAFMRTTAPMYLGTYCSKRPVCRTRRSRWRRPRARAS